MHDLTPYQTEIARAVLEATLQGSAHLFTVEMARGAGARELSAQIELLLMTLHMHDGGSLLKIAPPSEDASTTRLVDYLRESSLSGLWSVRPGLVRFGRAECRFFTFQEPALPSSPVGLVQVLEAQRVNRDAYDRLIRPLLTSGATVVLYGTPWNGETPFEELKQSNREAEAAGGPRRHFRVTWEEAAGALPGYRERVLAERARIGETHPAFQTGYALRPLPPLKPLLAPDQMRALAGTHARRHSPTPGVCTCASVVVTWLHQPPIAASSLLTIPGAQAVVTIAEQSADRKLRVVDHRWVQAPDAASLGRRIAKLLDETWKCDRVIASLPHVERKQTMQFRRLMERFLEHATVAWATPDDARESDQLLSMIAAANAGKLALYLADGSPEYRTLRHELEEAIVEACSDGLLRVRLPQRNEGFMRGLVLLADEALSATKARMDVLEPALAS